MKEWNFDAVIIGGGVTGCAIARELSRYEMHAALIEREEDVCSGTSKANSAIVHAGHDAVPGSVKARFNVEGNRMMGELAEDLDFEFDRNGSLILCFAEEDRPALQELYDKGVKNGVPDLKIITGDEARAMEPNVSDAVVAALYAPTGGIVCPFGLTIALAENACDNGVEFIFNEEVKKVVKTEKGYDLETADGVVHTTYVTKPPVAYATKITTLARERKRNTTPRRGASCLLDKEQGIKVSNPISSLRAR